MVYPPEQIADLASRYPYIQISRYPNIRISKHLYIQISIYPNIRIFISRYLNLQISKCPNIQISKYSDIQIFINPDIPAVEKSVTNGRKMCGSGANRNSSEKTSILPTVRKRCKF
jgi:hypothetical protein